jgi:hypothetical protein
VLREAKGWVLREAKSSSVYVVYYKSIKVELEHLKIETRLIDEKFANAMGEYVT